MGSATSLKILENNYLRFYRNGKQNNQLPYSQAKTSTSEIATTEIASEKINYRNRKQTINFRNRTYRNRKQKVESQFIVNFILLFFGFILK